ncbi:hypothetical protein EDB85DRAFT_1891788 [Lactarius pseudohatsudake]|nr:hypothetical protein EDB85DRAFT_1891788 [Lactarius pseudohatsudake]
MSQKAQYEAMTFGPDFQDKQGEIVATESRLLGNKTSQVRLHEVVILVVGMEMDQEYDEGNICSTFLETTPKLHWCELLGSPGPGSSDCLAEAWGSRKVLRMCSNMRQFRHVCIPLKGGRRAVLRVEGVKGFLTPCRGAVGDEREDEERMMSSIVAAVAGVQVEDGEPHSSMAVGLREALQ